MYQRLESDNKQPTKKNDASRKFFSLHRSFSYPLFNGSLSLFIFVFFDCANTLNRRIACFVFCYRIDSEVF